MSFTKSIGLFAMVALLAAGVTGLAVAAEDCTMQLKEAHASADQVADAKTKSKVEKLLTKANEELTTEHDEEECLSYVARAKKILKIK